MFKITRKDIQTGFIATCSRYGTDEKEQVLITGCKTADEVAQNAFAYFCTNIANPFFKRISKIEISKRGTNLTDNTTPIFTKTY